MNRADPFAHLPEGIGKVRLLYAALESDLAQRILAGTERRAPGAAVTAPWVTLGRSRAAEVFRCDVGQAATEAFIEQPFGWWCPSPALPQHGAWPS